LIVAIVDDKTVKVEDESGFDYEYPVSELLLIEDPMSEQQAYEDVTPTYREILDRNIDSNAVEKAQDDFKTKYKSRQTSGRGRNEVKEVDLHIHELIDNQIGLEPQDLREIQMEHFDRMMRVAKDDKETRVVFIHGVGQGILRTEIRKYLEMYYPEASFHDADYRKYGYGATEVRINYGRLQ
jgi:DNA-nicking Smr family endonuclease